MAALRPQEIQRKRLHRSGMQARGALCDKYQLQPDRFLSFQPNGEYLVQVGNKVSASMLNECLHFFKTGDSHFMNKHTPLASRCNEYDHAWVIENNYK